MNHSLAATQDGALVCAHLGVGRLGEQLGKSPPHGRSRLVSGAGTRAGDSQRTVPLGPRLLLGERGDLDVGSTGGAGWSPAPFRGGP